MVPGGSRRFSVVLIDSQWFSVVLSGYRWFSWVPGGSQSFSVVLIGSRWFSWFHCTGELTRKHVAEAFWNAEVESELRTGNIKFKFRPTERHSWT